GEAEAHARTAEGARELADTRTYFGLLDRLRRRAAAPRPGWTWEGLADLEQAARLPTPARDPVALRGEATGLLGSIDVRPRRELKLGMACARMALHPGGRLVALGQWKATAWLTINVVLKELDGGRTVRQLSCPPGVKWHGGRRVQDGVTALAFSP